MTARVSVCLVLDTAAAEFGVTKDDLLGNGRTRPLVKYRQAAMVVAHQMTGRGMPVIGREFHRDHTTILHAIRAWQSERELQDLADRLTRAVMSAAFREESKAPVMVSNWIEAVPFRTRRGAEFKRSAA